MKKKKQSGKNDYTYLLTHTFLKMVLLLVGNQEKGTITVIIGIKNMASELGVINLIHSSLMRAQLVLPIKRNFLIWFKRRIRRRQADLPKIESEIRKIEGELKELDEINAELRNQLTDQKKRRKSGFMDWLEEQVEQVSREKNKSWEI